MILKNQFSKLSQNLLDEGITDVNASSSVLSPGSDDFYFSGNLAMWTKFAHSLKARYYNRISNKGNFDSDIMNSISNGFGSGEAMFTNLASTNHNLTLGINLLLLIEKVKH